MWFLAIRHILSRKKQTLLVLMSITLGAMAYIVISGMMLGFHDYIINQLINNDAHVRISAREDYLQATQFDKTFFKHIAFVHWTVPPSGRRDNLRIAHPAAWYKRLDNDPDVAAYSPQLITKVIMRRGKVTESASLVGVEPQKQMQVTTVKKYMLAGQFSDLAQGGNRIVLGAGLLNNLGARVNETILVSSATSAAAKPFKIVGAYRFGIKAIDNIYAYTPLAQAQKVNHSPGQISDIAIRLNDVKQAQTIAALWGNLGSDKVQSWQQANENVLSVFRTQDIIRNFMTISILIVAGFGIYNILNILVNEKKREIAILRSIGYTPRDISKMFLYHGFILGLLGGLLGVMFGYLACRYIATLPLVNDEIGRGSTMLVSFQMAIYYQGYALALVSAIVASILPARSAGKLSPMQIIRDSG